MYLWISFDFLIRCWSRDGFFFFFSTTTSVACYLNLKKNCFRWLWLVLEVFLRLFCNAETCVANQIQTMVMIIIPARCVSTLWYSVRTFTWYSFISERLLSSFYWAKWLYENPSKVYKHKCCIHITIMYRAFFVNLCV